MAATVASAWGQFVEFLRMGALSAYDLGIEHFGKLSRALGDLGGNTNRRMPRSWQACSKQAMDSEPPSTPYRVRGRLWIALTAKGMRS